MPVGVALGKRGLGKESLAGSPLPDQPVPTITAPAVTVDSGGPDLTVSWTYSQPQGWTQHAYRIRFMNDAGTVTYFDSGWILGTAVSGIVDLDGEAVPHQSSDVTVRVAVRSASYTTAEVPSWYQIETSRALTVDWGNPFVAVDEPVDNETVTVPTGLTVSWTFSDDGGKTQSAYRVRVRKTVSEEVVFSTGWVASTDETVDLPFVFSDGLSYDILVQSKNNHGVRSGVA